MIKIFRESPHAVEKEIQIPGVAKNIFQELDVAEVVEMYFQPLGVARLVEGAYTVERYFIQLHGAPRVVESAYIHTSTTRCPLCSRNIFNYLKPHIYSKYLEWFT